MNNEKQLQAIIDDLERTIKTLTKRLDAVEKEQGAFKKEVKRVEDAMNRLHLQFKQRFEQFRAGLVHVKSKLTTVDNSVAQIIHKLQKR